jgi:integrase
MARPIHRFSAAKVKTAKPGMHCDGGGLYLQVTVGKDGELHRSWLFRYAISEIATSKKGIQRQKERQMGLGSIESVSLSDARAMANECRKQRLAGIDPIQARTSERSAKALANSKAMTFDQCRDAYIASHRSGWRNTKHAAQWSATLRTYVTPVFGSLPVQGVDTALVMKVMEPIWTTKPETAGRIRGRIEAILDWATARESRLGENPARWRGHLDKLLPARAKIRRVEHHAALPYTEVSAFISELQKRDGVAARALEFAILTASRTGEVLGAKWDEIDFDNRTWIVLADRMKAGREHRVPLTASALALLKAMQSIRQNDLVFPGNRRDALSNMALLMVLRRMRRADLTAHGFRSTFRDWAAERTNFSSEVVEMALAHAVSDKVEAAYRRGDLFEKRRRLMNAWAEYCNQAPATGRVLPLRSV